MLQRDGDLIEHILIICMMYHREVDFAMFHSRNHIGNVEQHSAHISAKAQTFTHLAYNTIPDSFV